ncbi:MAG: phosphatidate cytidylyltransferase [Rhodospirillales bacterium]
MGNLAVRSLSALVLAPLVLVAEWYGGLYFDLLVALLMILSVHEWIQMCKNSEAGGSTTTRSVIRFVGILYILAACFSLAWLRATHPDGAMLVLLMILAVWASDTGAYFAGTMIGGPKLAPAISPKKTWSGLLGGSLAAGGVGAAMAHFGGASQNIELLTGLGVMIGLFAAGGDLLESLVKRRFGVKDSGTLIPGHGGVLDRVDGLLAAAIGTAVASVNMGGHIELWP